MHLALETTSDGSRDLLGARVDATDTVVYKVPHVISVMQSVLRVSQLTERINDALNPIFARRGMDRGASTVVYQTALISTRAGDSRPRLTIQPNAGIHRSFGVQGIRDLVNIKPIEVMSLYPTQISTIVAVCSVPRSTYATAS